MRTRLGVAAAALVAVVGAVGCGSGSGSSAHAGGGRLTAASIARETSAAGSARLEMHGTQLADPTSTTPARTSVGTGEVDFKKRRGEVTTAAGVRGANEVRWIGSRMYWRVTAGAAPGAPAVKDSWIESGPGGGEDGISVDPVGALLIGPDPLAVLRSATASATTIGHEPVRGVPTTHLSVTLDLRALTKVLRSEGYTVDDPQMPTQPADVWVDAQGRLRRMATTSRSIEPAEAITIELFDYGVRVDVQPPPSAQIFHGQSSTVSGSAVPTSAPR